jgi:hypothetical protein
MHKNCWWWLGKKVIYRTFCNPTSKSKRSLGMAN